MIAPLRDLQSVVVAAERGAVVPLSGDPFLRRVADALRGGESRGGAPDIVGLLRQGMLRCHEHNDVALRVPKGSNWPTEQQWNTLGCSAEPAGAHDFLVRPRRWSPSWLDPNAPGVVDDAISERSRRVLRPVPSDPLVAALVGHDHYVSPGQRAAVQAAFLSEPGATLIVNLPTGGGKTLAFQLPALAWEKQSGLTIVVVPTVALAKDQAARFQDLVDRGTPSRSASVLPLAYHGGLDTATKTALKSAVKEGRIPILFASAEAAMGPLRGPLFEAAKQGRLKVFAIDEAHVVTQWGQQFRPEFQSLSGLRQALLDACPPTSRFRTLLLTATLTSECCDALIQLFGGGPVEVISEAALRPEPGFLILSADSESERQAKVMEAVFHLPRPLILYTTRRDHAEEWLQRLRTAGFRRVRMVRGGDLSDDAGDELLRQWREGAVDIVVGTSAFGLGVDQQEVRSVVHACLPETIDRYYQEVGRAGRDGSAAVALLASTPGDADTAKGLSRERLISIDRGFERWDAMWVSHRRGPDQGDTYLVSLDARPPDIVEPGIRNASWNLRTLVLMARAGLITFAAHPPPEIPRLSGESADVHAARVHQVLAAFSRQVALRIADPQHLDRLHWDRVVHEARSALRRADEEALDLVLELRGLKRPLNDILRRVYTLYEPLVVPPRLAGSCPVTRQSHAVNFVSDPPRVTSLTKTGATMALELERALRPSTDGVGRSWIAYTEVAHDARSRRKQRESILSVLRFAVAGGVVELAVPDGFIGENEWSQLIAVSSTRFLMRAIDDHDFLAPPLAVSRLTLLPEAQTQHDVARAMSVHRPRHVLLVPRQARDPGNPNRGLLDVVRHLSLEDLLSRLQS